MDIKDTYLEGKKIMWVEDDKFFNDILFRKLSKKGCVLVNTDDGKKALDLAKKEKPDVILLDILLPEMSGFEILEQIRKEPTIKDTPVILLTNLGQKEDIEKGHRLGATKFLIKATISLDEIVDEIAGVLE